MGERRNRAARARALAGLSVGQAARRIGCAHAVLAAVEASDAAFAACDHAALAALYGVSPAWLAGEVEQHDYAAVRRMPGGSDLAFADRDAIAELIAAQQRRPS